LNLYATKSKHVFCEVLETAAQSGPVGGMVSNWMLAIQTVLLNYVGLVVSNWRLCLMLVDSSCLENHLENEVEMHS
jgi:hypothetical protein